MIEGYGDREKYTCSVNSLDMSNTRYVTSVGPQIGLLVREPGIDFFCLLRRVVI